MTTVEETLSATEETAPARKGTRRVDMRRRPKLERMARDAQVLKLAREGIAQSEIAKRMGYANAGGVSKAVVRALRQAVTPDAEFIREKHTGLLTEAFAEVREQMSRPQPTFQIPEGMDSKEGDEWVKRVVDALGDRDRDVLAAIDRLVKLMEREARLFGADAPQKTEISGSVPSVVVFHQSLQFPGGVVGDPPEVIDGD